MKYFLHKNYNLVETLINNFYSENYDQEIVNFLIDFDYEKDCFCSDEIEQLSQYLEYMYIFFDKNTEFIPLYSTKEKEKETFLEEMLENIKELDDYFINKM